MQDAAVLPRLSNIAFTLPPNTAASMLLQKSLSRLMSLHDSCTQLIPGSRLRAVQRYVAP